MKMCLATRISRSKESADFSNVIPVVAVGDMVTSVFAESHRPRLIRTGDGVCLAVAAFCRQSRVRALGRVVMNARSGRVSKTCSSSKFRIAHCREYKERLELNVRM